MQDWKGPPGSLSQSSAVPCTSLRHWLFLFSLSKGVDVLSILLDGYPEWDLCITGNQQLLSIWFVSSYRREQFPAHHLKIRVRWMSAGLAGLEGVQGYLHSLSVCLSQLWISTSQFPVSGGWNSSALQQRVGTDGNKMKGPQFCGKLKSCR